MTTRIRRWVGTVFKGADTMAEYLLGVDLGTGGCKTTVISTTGRFVSDGYTEYPSHHPHIGWVEQRPADWFFAMVNSLQISAEKGGFDLREIIGVSVDASAHNTVLLDKDGAVIRNTIMWQDQRAQQEVEYLKENALELIKRTTFSIPSTTWSLPQLMWIRDHEPQVFSRISLVLFIDDYVRYQLTGAYSTTHIQAQGSLMFDNVHMKWSEDLVKLSGLPISALPEIKKPTDIAGRITAEAAARSGLKEGIPVVMGASDTALESYAVGGLKPGDCVLKMATAGGINVFREVGLPFRDTFAYSHVVDGIWYYGRGTVSAAQALRWYRDTFCQKEIAEERAGGENTYHLLDREAEAISPGANGLFFHPYMSGERAPYWDAKLRASFTGFSSLHTRGHFNRALLEGVTFSLRQCFSIMEEFGRIEKISFVGGGAKSPLWRSILADVFNRTIVKYKRDDSSLGAAMLAGVALGVFGSHEEAVEKTAVVDCVTKPNPENVEKYNRLFPLYVEIHDDLAATYRKYKEE